MSASAARTASRAILGLWLNCVVWFVVFILISLLVCFLGKLVQNLVSPKLLLVKISGGYGRERLLQTSIPTKTKACLFRLRRGKFLAAKRADIEARRATHQQGQPLPLHCHLIADGVGRALSSLARTEEACPLANPLVQSLHSAPAHWPRLLPRPLQKGQ